MTSRHQVETTVAHMRNTMEAIDREVGKDRIDEEVIERKLTYLESLIARLRKNLE